MPFCMSCSSKKQTKLPSGIPELNSFGIISMRTSSFFLFCGFSLKQLVPVGIHGPADARPLPSPRPEYLSLAAVRVALDEILKLGRRHKSLLSYLAQHGGKAH